MKNKSNKKIYIILSYTGTIPSQIIRMYTKAEFSHVSVSLDPKLKEMYSFARLNPYNPFVAGFVHEDIENGTFSRFQNTKAEIYSLDISDRQYRKIKKLIKNMVQNKKIYKYNLIGVLAIIFNIRYKRANYFYCAEFVKYLIDEAEVGLKLPDMVKPMDFRRKRRLKLEYKGLLKDYRAI